MATATAAAMRRKEGITRKTLIRFWKNYRIVTRK